MVGGRTSHFTDGTFHHRPLLGLVSQFRKLEIKNKTPPHSAVHVLFETVVANKLSIKQWPWGTCIWVRSAAQTAFFGKDWLLGSALVPRVLYSFSQSEPAASGVGPVPLKCSSDKLTPTFASTLLRGIHWPLLRSRGT